MKECSGIGETREAIAAARQAGKRIGFVPTMGNLHAGHLALVDKAREHADFIVSSIFVNPMQFGANEDLASYPHTPEADRAGLRDRQVALLFAPGVADVYPVPMDQHTSVEVPGLSELLCGASRPGHFRGVATVVSKLFNIVQPDVAVFGEKDFQQLAVIRRMVRDLCFPVEIIGVPTIRESDGLAMSSRNNYLSDEDRKVAPEIYRLINSLRSGILSGSENFRNLEEQVRSDLLAAGFVPDYVSVRKQSDLSEAHKHDAPLVILVAAFLGKTRLIDNITV